MVRWLPAFVGLLAAAATFAVVAPLTGGSETEPVDEPATPAESGRRAAAGRAVFARMGCGGCHEFRSANATGQIGPDLDERLLGYDSASLAAKIVDPYPDLPPDAFAAMPENFGERLSAAELEALVAFLLAAPARRG